MTTVRRNVAVFRDHLLPASETFVKSQGEALRTWRAQYFGCRDVHGIALPPERRMVLNEGSLLGWGHEALFKGFSWAPPLERALRAFGAELLHAHFGPDGALVLPLARGLGLPLIVTFHGYDATVRDEVARKSHRTHRLYVRRRAVLQREARRFIAVSEFVRGRLLAQGYPEERVVTHYIGVDTSCFRPEMVEREPIILFTGRLVRQKGLQVLIRALARLSTRRRRSPMELVVIGDGPMRNDLEAAAKVVLPCRFLGTQPSAEVRAWMNRASVFCVPSLVDETGWQEAFGLVFAEAQAMELPPVSTRSGGIGEAVADGETGFLVPPDDPDALAARIGLLLDNPDLRQRFGKAGRKRILARFDLALQTGALEEIYEAVRSEQLSLSAPRIDSTVFHPV